MMNTILKTFHFCAASLAIILSIFIYINIPKGNCQAFSDQTQSFLHARLDIPNLVDSVYNNGKYYWPQGPFPSLILLPFQFIFGESFNQTLMQPILVFILGYLAYKLSRIKGFSRNSSLFLVEAFLFASFIVGIITEPCYSFFSHTATLVLLMASIVEVETNKRPLILGLLIGIILATRPTAAFISIPILYILIGKNYKNSIKNFTKFLLPIVFIIFLLMWFNYARFGNPFETGYGNNNTGEFLSRLRKNGIFDYSYIISNSYFYLLASIQPILDRNYHIVLPFFTYNTMGLSIFITSPFFIYSFRSLKKESKFIRACFLSVILTLIILLSYYHSGWVQFGTRFASDFFPTIFLLTLYGLNVNNLTNLQKIIISLSSLINIYLLTTGFFLFKR